jgi:hypothetical protein
MYEVAMKFLQGLLVFALGLGIAILLKLFLRALPIPPELVKWINTAIFCVIGYACGYQNRSFGKMNAVNVVIGMFIVISMSIFLYLFNSMLGYSEFVNKLSEEFSNPESVANNFLNQKVGQSGVLGFYIYSVVGEGKNWFVKAILWLIQLWFFALSLFWASLGWLVGKEQ